MRCSHTSPLALAFVGRAVPIFAGAAESECLREGPLPCHAGRLLFPEIARTLRQDLAEDNAPKDREADEKSV